MALELSENFTWEEFRSGDGVDVPERYRENVRMLAFALEVVRDVVGKPVRIISGYRTASHNEKVGGAPYSQHKFGRAADIFVEGWRPERLAGVLECLIARDEIPRGGIGADNTRGFVHYDIRGEEARWRYD